jgi:hypothetical protein
VPCSKSFVAVVPEIFKQQMCEKVWTLHLRREGLEVNPENDRFKNTEHRNCDRVIVGFQRITSQKS